MKKIYLIFSLFIFLTSCEKGEVYSIDENASIENGIDKLDFNSKILSLEDLKEEKILREELTSLQNLK